MRQVVRELCMYELDKIVRVVMQGGQRLDDVDVRTSVDETMLWLRLISAS